MPSSSTFIGICPNACTASVWNNIPFSFASAPISARGCIDPISLLAAITDIKIVSGRIAAFNSSSLIMPSLPTFT